jgi:hypothetical protein
MNGNILERSDRVTRKLFRPINSKERRISMNGKTFAKVARMALTAMVIVSALTLALGPAQTAYAWDRGKISYGQTVEGKISHYNYDDNWFFYGSAGDAVTITMNRTSGDLDPYLALHFWNGAERVKLITDDDSGGAGNSLIDGYVLPYDGWYCIGAHRYDHEYGATAGSYLLTLTLLPGANACPAHDSDCDGFTNDFESWLIEGFKPVLIFDEEEPQCVDVENQTATLYQVTPYATAGRYGKSGALITVVILYPDDCGMYGTGLGSHPGDAEALRIFAVHNPVHDVWYIGGILMTRHGDPWEAYKPDKFRYSGSHPVIFVSESKHAMYSSKNECESYALWTFENCGEGVSLDLFTPPQHNVGERGAPAFDAMRDAPSNVLVSLFSDGGHDEYSGHTEYTWTDVDFCGGWVGANCGGALSGKWWPHVDPQERAFQESLIEEAVAP